jgi:hypothetical protein
MQTRILDLDGSLVEQTLLLQRTRAAIFRLQDWGPSLRLACGARVFRRFQKHLALRIGSDHDTSPVLNFVGSGDFHHVSLALLRRLREPCNLLVLDNHPDWMRGIPFLHCGTWLYHAARLPQVGRIFHVGGDVDFDNAYRFLAPWPLLRSGKIIVSPARRRFQGRSWTKVPHRPVRQEADKPARCDAIEEWLGSFRADLIARPLYISLDKDVFTAAEAVVNWDSGYLMPEEVGAVLQAFVTAAGGKLAGMDIVGDWSPIRLNGLMRRLLHWTEHPALLIDAEEATRRNERLNLFLLDQLLLRGEPDPQRVLRLVREDSYSPEHVKTFNPASEARFRRAG